MMTGLVILYIVVALLLMAVFTMTLVEEVKKNGESARARRLSARLLLAVVWPLAIPMALYYALCLASNRQFPSFKRKRY